MLLTSPLSATDEIINVYNAGLADFELAAPIVLSSIGASSNDILAMMDRFKRNQSTMSAASQPKAAATDKADANGAAKSAKVNGTEQDDVSKSENVTKGTQEEEDKGEKLSKKDGDKRAKKDKTDDKTDDDGEDQQERGVSGRNGQSDDEEEDDVTTKKKRKRL